MVFAGAALATTTAACGGKAKSAATTKGQNEESRNHGGGGCVEPDPTKAEALEKQKAEAQTDEEKARLDAEIVQAKQPVCMPYGAPPRRRRVV